jgi:hypothetical protein
LGVATKLNATMEESVEIFDSNDEKDKKKINVT